ncbi:MAG TPA: hypothetical protein VGP72_17570 [Planctomycetota bacterium]|jgi:methionyl-tRNA synthetase
MTDQNPPATPLPPTPPATPAPATGGNPAAATPPATGAAPVPAAQASAVPLPGVALVSIDEFKKSKLVTAEIISAEAHPKADRLVVLQIKIGERTKQIVAGIRQFYPPETLVGRTIIVVDNLQPTKLRGLESFGMLLAVRLPDGGVKLVSTDGPVPSGLEVS